MHRSKALVQVTMMPLSSEITFSSADLVGKRRAEDGKRKEKFGEVGMTDGGAKARPMEAGMGGNKTTGKDKVNVQAAGEVWNKVERSAGVREKVENQTILKERMDNESAVQQDAEKSGKRGEEQMTTAQEDAEQGKEDVGSGKGHAGKGQGAKRRVVPEWEGPDIPEEWKQREIDGQR